MTRPLEAVSQIRDLRERMIVALDVDSADKAREIVGELFGQVGAFKIGLQLFAAAGPEFVREIVNAGNKVFLDLKFHDIPNTVAKASVEAVRLGVWMFNVHTFGGSEMLRQTVREVNEVCVREGINRPLIIGVTVLTSANNEAMQEVGVTGDVESQVVKLSQLAAGCGLDGVVASPKEVIAVKKTVADPNFLAVTPGIRPSNATGDDQKRVTTFGQAVAAGADFVVIGRPIVQANDRLAALEQIVAEN